MIEHRKGRVHRLVEVLGMGYISEPEADRIWPFAFSQLNGYSGQLLKKESLLANAPVSFVLRDGTLVEVMLDSALAHSGGI